jgi:hypothetical protein
MPEYGIRSRELIAKNVEYAANSNGLPLLCGIMMLAQPKPKPKHKHSIISVG